MSQIQAVSTAYSISPMGHKLFSPIVTFPRIVLAELNTHRILSRNSASSRAIPFKKMVEMVKENPFVPMAFQEDHSGMQGTKYQDSIVARQSEQEWLIARDYAVSIAGQLNGRDVTKQLCNRLLEPFMWHTALLSGTHWENFFSLRCPQYCPYEDNSIRYRSKKDLLAKESHFVGLKEDATIIDWLHLNEGKAEIHVSLLAEAIWDSINETKPRELKEGEWHIIYEDKIDEGIREQYNGQTNTEAKLQIATAMAARTSYTVVGDEKELSYERLIGIYNDKLLPRPDEPFHASPFEHCARAMYEREYFEYSKSYLTNIVTKEMEEEEQRGITMIRLANPHFNRGMRYKITEFGWNRNFRGFVQLRHIIEIEGHI